MISRADILKRKEQLDADRAQLLANLNAVLGALQECDFWLARVEDAGPESTVKPQEEPK